MPKKKKLPEIDPVKLERDYNQFIQSRNGRELIREYGLDCEKTWEVLGEDNSYGGMFDRSDVPTIGLFKGKLHDVIIAAVSDPRWYSWGGGGRIRLYRAPIRPRIKKV